MEQSSKIFSVGIIGAGAAGLTASIYASRYQLSNVVFGTLWGGEIANASIIENWPGDKSITGAELTQRFLDHAKDQGGEVKADKIIKIIKNANHDFDLVTESGDKVGVKEVILATGTRRRHLNVPGEKELSGRGVSYCATCDAAFFKDKVTAVIGGGDSALTAALHLSQFSPQVFLIARGPELKGEPIWRGRVHDNPKIEVLHSTEITEILGKDTVAGVKLSRPHEGKDVLDLQGVFVEIGADPDTELAQDLGIKLDEEGFIQVSENMETSEPCIYAAGDATTGNAHLDQIISAAAEGGLAARSVFLHLSQKSNKPSIFNKIFG